MFNGFVFVLLFTGFSSSADENVKDLTITSVNHTISNNSAPESGKYQLSNATNGLTPQSKGDNSQIIQRTLKLVLTLMNKNKELQAQTNYVLKLLVGVLEKNVDSFNDKDSKIMNDILSNLEFSLGPIIESGKSRLRSGYHDLKSSLQNNESFCAQALLKILEVIQTTYLQLIYGLSPNDLNQIKSIIGSDSVESLDEYPVPLPYHRPQHIKQMLTFLVPSSDDESQQAKPTGHKTIDNLIIIKPVNDHDSETQNKHISIHSDDETSGSIENNLVNEVPVLSEEIINGDQINHLIVFDNSVKKYSSDPTNHFNTVDWKPSKKEIDAPVPSKFTAQDFTPSYLSSPSSNNYYPWVPKQENHKIDHMHLLPYDKNHKAYNNIGKYILGQLLPKNSIQSPNVESNTKRYFVSEQLVHHPMIGIKQNSKKNKVINYNDLPYSNIYPYGYNNKNVDHLPIVNKEEKYYDFDNKPTTDRTKIKYNQDILETSINTIQKIVKDLIANKYLTYSNYPIKKVVDQIEPTTTVNIVDIDEPDYLLHENKYQSYDKNYVDYGLDPEKYIDENDNLMFHYILENINPNSAGKLYNVELTTKSPIPYNNEDKSHNWNDNHSQNHPWNYRDYSDGKDIFIPEDRNSQPGSWIGNHNYNNNYWYNDNHYKNPQGHLNAVYVTPNPYANYEHHDSWQEKPSNYNIEENLVPIDGKKVVTHNQIPWNNNFWLNENNHWDGNRHWYDQHKIKVEFEFTTKNPVSIDEVADPNHYNYWKNPFYNNYVGLELTTTASPVIIHDNHYNIWPEDNNYDSEKNTTNYSKIKYYDQGNMKIPTNYNPENNYFNSETMEMTPNDILDQVTEETMPSIAIINADHPNSIYKDYSENSDVIVENVTPSNYAEDLETTTKVMTIIKKDRIIYHFPLNYPVDKGLDGIKYSKNIVNQVTSPKPYYWDDVNQWNQHFEITTKGPIIFNNILNSNHYDEWYNNRDPSYLQNSNKKNIETSHIFDYFPLNKYHFNQKIEVTTKGQIFVDKSLDYDKLYPVPSKIEHYPKGTHYVYENPYQNSDKLWNPHPFNHNAYNNGFHTSYNYIPSFYDFSTRKYVIEITTLSPNVLWNAEAAQKPYESENDYQPLVYYESVTQNPNTNSDDSPPNNGHPWQLDIEVTTKYSIILHDVPEHEFPGTDNFYPWQHSQHPRHDGKLLDSSEQKYGNIETSTLSYSTVYNNKPINGIPFGSFVALKPIVTTHKTFRTTNDVQESEEPTQTLDALKNPDLYHTSSEGNSTGLNPNEVNFTSNHGLEPEPEVIKLIEETIENIEKNVETNTDPKMLNSIERLKKMIKEKNISNNNYIQILQTFHDIKEYFKLNTDVSKVMSLPYLFRLINKNNTQTNEDHLVEISYLIKSPKPIVIYPYYYVKYHVPMTEIDQLISQNPYMSENDEELHIMLLRLSKIADLSPALKKVRKEDVDKLTVKHGNLIKTNVIDSGGTVVPLQELPDHSLKNNNTEAIRYNIDGSKDNIKEVRIKVNNKPYHTITTISDFKSTPIIEDKNSPRIDNLNDLNNPFRKVFPTHKLIKATELASDFRKNGQPLLSSPFGREKFDKADENSLRRFKVNDQNIKDKTRDGRPLRYKTTTYDPNAFKVTSRSRNIGEIVQPIIRVGSDSKGKKRVYRRVGEMLSRYSSD